MIFAAAQTFVLTSQPKKGCNQEASIITTTAHRYNKRDEEGQRHIFTS